MKLDPETVRSRRNEQPTRFLVLFLSAFGPGEALLSPPTHPSTIKHPWGAEPGAGTARLPEGRAAQSPGRPAEATPFPCPLPGATDFRALPTKRAQPVTLRGK